MRKLTDRQQEVLSFISDYTRTNSFPPTVREIADEQAQPFLVFQLGQQPGLVDVLLSEGTVEFAEPQQR